MELDYFKDLIDSVSIRLKEFVEGGMWLYIFFWYGEEMIECYMGLLLCGWLIKVFLVFL